MLGKVAFLSVALVAIFLGKDYVNFKSQLAWIRGCHGGHYSPHKFLATKTPYDSPSADLKSHHDHEKCEALQLWMMVRHGTRNPSKKVIRKMLNLLPGLRDQIVTAHDNGKGELCSEELELLNQWSPPERLTESEEKKLVEQGEAELRGIGSRFRKRFPKIFEQYNNSTHKFKFTKTSRTEASCNSFVEGGLGKHVTQEVWYPEALHADPVLRFYKGCPKWKKEVDKNPNTYLERKRFENSAPFTQLREKLVLRTGLAKEDISVDNVEAVYMTCAFETAWEPEKISPWCHLFDEPGLDVMQYRQDIEYYWVDGYGYELTYKQACPAIIDMIDHIKAKAEDINSSPSLIAYFTHSGTLLKLTARLGLFNDSEPLLHSNYHYHTHRKWRTSEIDKFATNIAVVLYKCSNEMKVGMLFQENIIPIPGCSANGELCSLQEFLSVYNHLAQDCNMYQMCQL